MLKYKVFNELLLVAMYLAKIYNLHTTYILLTYLLHKQPFK